MGEHLPLRLRAHPAPGDQAPRLQQQLHDLRRRRRAAADDAGDPLARPRPEALPAAGAGGADQQPQERARRLGDGALDGVRRSVAGTRGGLRRLPAAAAAGERAGLRRPDLHHRRPAAGLPGRRRALPAPLPARPRRRVPGHQPRPVRAHPRAGRHGPRSDPEPPAPSCASSATRTSRSTPSAARTSATSSSSSATTRTPRWCCWSRTTARRRPSCPRPTPSSPATPAASRSGSGPTPATASRSSATSPTTSTTRPRSSPARSTGSADEHELRPADVAVFYRTNAQSRVFEEVFLRVGLPYKVVGGVRFYERKEVRDALAYLRVLANPADTVSLRRILNVPKRGIGDRAEALLAAFADRERIGFADCAGARGRRPGDGDAVAEERAGVRAAARRAARGRRIRCRAGRDHRGGAGEDRLPRGAGRRGHDRVRGPRREPRRAGRRRPRVHRAGAGRDARRVPRAGLARRRRRLRCRPTRAARASSR